MRITFPTSSMLNNLAIYLEVVEPSACETVKLVVLVPVPPGVVTRIGPVVALVGTNAVIWVGELTVTFVAGVELN